MGQEPSRGRRFGVPDMLAFGGIVGIVTGWAVSRRSGSVPISGRPAGDLRAQPVAATGSARSASAGWRIPWAGWKDILWRTYAQIGEDRILAVAAGVVFYGLLALFPAISAFVSIYGLFADPATIDGTVSLLAEVVPQDAIGPVKEQVDRVASAGTGSLSFTFAFSLALALWSANAGMKAVMDALNVAYGEREGRGFVHLTLVSFALTFGMLAAGLVAVTTIVVFPVAMSFLGIETLASGLVRWLRWPLLLAALLLGLGVLYRFGPSRREPRWQWISVGSVGAALLWLGGSAAFSFYLSNFANYGAAYGSLAAGIGLMMWLWLSAIVILLGAELNVAIERRAAEISTAPSADAPITAASRTRFRAVGR